MKVKPCDADALISIIAVFFMVCTCTRFCHTLKVKQNKRRQDSKLLLKDCTVVRSVKNDEEIFLCCVRYEFCFVEI